MKTHQLLIIILLIMANQTIAQTTELPYRQIPDYPESYNEGNVAARVIDGLGFRYYWATEGLMDENMTYRPAEDVRSIGETIGHIYGLSRTIVNAPQSKVNAGSDEKLSWIEMRKRTLENIQLASQLLKEGKPGDMDSYKIIFGSGDNTTEFPFWNMLNGPIADAIYHTGQVVAFRRAAGNPIQKGVRMLTGRAEE